VSSSLQRIAFQACSFNHSDISPFIYVITPDQ
jgi:hypothetical protein